VIAGVDPDPDAARRIDAPVVGALEHVRDWSAIDAAVVATVSDLAVCAETLEPLLERGLAVVSTCEELLFPWLRHAELAGRLETAAIGSGGRLLGTGVNPGFLMDLFPVVASSVCLAVRSIRVQRIQDASTRRLPFQNKIGAGLSPEQFAAGVEQGTLRHVGMGESLHFIAHYVGLDIERWDETLAPVMGGDGCATGVRQVARGYRGDEVIIELEFVAAVGQRDPRDRVVIIGDPPVDLVWNGGVHGDIATSAVVLGTIDRLVKAAPGLYTMATLPLSSRCPAPLACSAGRSKDD